MPKIVLCVTGASGLNYALAIARELKRQKTEVHCVVTENAKLVMSFESPNALKEFNRLCFRVYGEKEVSAAPASGSFRADAVVVCPCSMKTLSAIANGYAYNLVPREMPWSALAFENALKLSRLGVVVAPASPGFYDNPKTIKDLVDFVAGRVLVAAGVANKLYPEWKGKQEKRDRAKAKKTVAKKR
jgi:4-hydroxy-3-polyprenylbenzoate decarboxylase